MKEKFEKQRTCARNAYARGGFCFTPFRRGVWCRLTAKAKKLGRKDGKASVGLSAIPYFFVPSCAYTSIHVVSVPVVSAGAAVWVAWGITWSTAAENTDLNGA